MSQTPNTTAPNTEHPPHATPSSEPSNKGPDTRAPALGPQGSGSPPLLRNTHSSAELDISTSSTEPQNNEPTQIPAKARLESSGTTTSPAPKPTTGALEMTPAPRNTRVWGPLNKIPGFRGGSASKIPESTPVQLVQAAIREGNIQFKGECVEKSIIFRPEDIDRWKLALETAAEKGNERALELLLSIKGKVTTNINEDPNAISNRVSDAAEGGTLDAIDAADKKTPDVNVAPCAIDNRVLDANEVSDLLRKATSEVFDKFACSCSSQPPMMAAVKLLLNGITKAELLPEEKDRNPLQLAAGRGYASTVNILLEYFDPNEPLSRYQPGGRTALQAAAEGGYRDVVELLLSRGADVNAPPAQLSGRTALQAAAEGRYQDVVELLLSRGADVNAPPARLNGRTALQAAAEGGYGDVVDYLLIKGANVNAGPAENGGRTALQAAAERGHTLIVKSLLRCGADINAKPARLHGKSALEAAVGHPSILELFRSLTIYDKSLHSMCLNEPVDKPVDQRFLDLIGSINSEDSSGQTPLHIATARPFKNAVEWLLKNGASTNMTDLDDRSPLESTIYSLSQVRKLVNGSSKTVPPDTENEVEIFLEILQLLLKYGATPRAHTTDRSLDWRKIFPCESDKSGTILELKETQDLDHTANKDPEHPRPMKNELTYTTFFNTKLGMGFVENWLSRSPSRSLYLELPEPPKTKKLETELVWLPYFKERPNGWNTDSPRLASVHLEPLVIKYSIRYEFITITKKSDVDGGISDVDGGKSDVDGGKSDVDGEKHKKTTGLKLKRLLGHISWTMLARQNKSEGHSPSGSGRGWSQIQVKTMRYRSTLSHHWIPQHSFECFTFFLHELREMWSDLLTESRNHLDQDHRELLDGKYGLEEASETTSYLEHLFDDARNWSQFRAQLTTHVQICHKTLNKYKDGFFFREIECSENFKEEKFNKEVESLSQEISHFESRFKDEIKSLETKTQGLVDFKLNLLQAYESQRSNVTAVSMKRLTWITFIFLPSMFVASLFGMNIDILSANPNWTWYPIICAPFLALLLFVWIISKYIDISIQKRRIRKNKKKQHKDLEARSVDPENLSCYQQKEVRREGERSEERAKGRKLNQGWGELKKE